MSDWHPIRELRKYSGRSSPISMHLRVKRIWRMLSGFTLSSYLLVLARKAQHTRTNLCCWAIAWVSVRWLTNCSIPSRRYVIFFLVSKGHIINIRQGCTDSCEEGPFFTTDAPEVPSGSDISGPHTVGERMFFQATIKNTKGEGISGAKADVVCHACFNSLKLVAYGVWPWIVASWRRWFVWCPVP